MKSYRAAIIGVGFIGTAHIEALRRLGNVDVVALASRTNAAGKASCLHVPLAFGDWREMIDSVAPDVVHICTPNSTHFEMAMYALERSIHVVCEKPLCTSVEQADALEAAARGSKVVAAVNYHNRFYPAAAELKAMVATGELGSIFSVHGGYLQDWLIYETDYNWRLLSQFGGSTRAVADIGSHWLDLAEYVTELRVTEVMAEFGRLYDQRRQPMGDVETFGSAHAGLYREIDVDTEDFAALTMRFDNGAIGSAVISQVYAGKKNALTLSVGGTRQSAEWNSEIPGDVLIGRRDIGNLMLTKDPVLFADEVGDLISYPAGHVEGFPDALKQTLSQIYAAIGDPAAPRRFASFADGARSVLLCERIYESAMSRHWVKI